jgi:hypothetical protein
MSDMTQSLLNIMMAARSGQDTRPMMEEMLNSNGDMDPMTRMLLTQALARDENQDDTEDPNVIIIDQDDYKPSRRQLALDRLRHRFQQMTQQIAEMSEALDVLQARSDDLADALGACYLCWGEDPRCPECAGKGAPGSLLPDPRAYREWVLPAMRTQQTFKQRHLERKANLSQTDVEGERNER